MDKALERLLKIILESFNITYIYCIIDFNQAIVT